MSHLEHQPAPLQEPRRASKPMKPKPADSTKTASAMLAKKSAQPTTHKARSSNCDYALFILTCVSTLGLYYIYRKRRRKDRKKTLTRRLTTSNLDEKFTSTMSAQMPPRMADSGVVDASPSPSLTAPFPHHAQPLLFSTTPVPRTPAKSHRPNTTPADPHHLAPGLPPTLPKSVSNLFIDSSPAGDASRAAVPSDVLERENSFFEEPIVDRAVGLIHRYVVREEAALLLQASWRLVLLTRTADRLRTASVDIEREAKELEQLVEQHHSHRDSQRDDDEAGAASADTVADLPPRPHHLLQSASEQGVGISPEGVSLTLGPVPTQPPTTAPAVSLMASTATSVSDLPSPLHPRPVSASSAFAELGAKMSTALTAATPPAAAEPPAAAPSAEDEAAAATVAVAAHAEAEGKTAAEAKGAAKSKVEAEAKVEANAAEEAHTMIIANTAAAAAELAGRGDRRSTYRRQTTVAEQEKRREAHQAIESAAQAVVAILADAQPSLPPPAAAMPPPLAAQPSPLPSVSKGGAMPASKKQPFWRTTAVASGSSQALGATAPRPQQAGPALFRQVSSNSVPSDGTDEEIVDGLSLPDLERRAQRKVAEAKRAAAMAEAARIAADRARKAAEERLAAARERRQLRTNGQL